MDSLRVVLDTNAWISYAFFRNRETAVVRTIQRVISREIVFLASRETLEELYDVLIRPAWDKYISLAKHVAFFRQVAELAEVVEVTTELNESTDPKDNKFLSLALDGRANFLVTGDQDLLTLCYDQNGQFVQPWHNVQILTPAHFIAEIE